MSARLKIFTLAVAALVVIGCDQTDNDGTTPDNPPPTNVSPTPTDTGTTDTGTTDAVASESMKAMCELVPIGDSKVKGAVSFTQEGSMVKIRGEVTGLAPGKHGFHVHEHGDLSDKETGKSAGGHFNPTNQPHGKMTDDKRHVGDLGNIEANEEGIAMIDMNDSIISLNGEHSIVGRSLVIHADADQFTQPSGDAGDRVAFGIIEKQSDDISNRTDE